MIRQLIIIGAGGFLGAVSRFLLSAFINKNFDPIDFPYGTLIVNITGCLIFGFLGGLAELKGYFSLETRLFFFVGILGSYTTFATFGFETLMLFKQEHYFSAFGNVFLQLFAGIIAVWIGFTLSKLFT